MNRQMWAAALFLLGGSAAWAQSDTIRLRDTSEPDLTCEILEMTWKDVKFNILAGDTLVSQSRPSKEIKEIVFGNDRKPFELGSAEQDMGNGEFDQAIPRLQKVVRDSRCPEPIKQLAYISMVKCYLWSRQPEKALAMIADFRKAMPNTFYLAESYSLQYEAHRSKSPPDISSMEKTLNEFGAEAESKNRDWSKAAEIMRGELYEFQEKWAQALAIHSKYTGDPAVGRDAKLGELRCLYATKNWSGLKAKSDAIVSEAKTNKKMDPQLKAGGFTGLGDALLNTGKTKDALVEYMRVVEVLRMEIDGTREHEAAIAKAAIACSRYAGELQEANQKATYKGRARELQKELEALYPGSTWHKVLKDEIR